VDECKPLPRGMGAERSYNGTSSHGARGVAGVAGVGARGGGPPPRTADVTRMQAQDEVGRYNFNLKPVLEAALGYN